MGISKNSTVNRLTVKESIALIRWLEANVEFLHRVPRLEIAARAQQALGFTITGPNVAGACEAGDVHIEPFNADLTSDSNPGKLYFVAYAIAELYDELGVQRPEYLRAIISNKSVADITDAYNAHRAKRG